MENRENLFKQYKKDWPQTVGETDKVFDNDNFIDWLCQQTKALTDEIEEKNAKIKSLEDSLLDVTRKSCARVDELQSRISELEKGNDNYNKLLKMSLHMAKLLSRTLDFDEFMKSNNLPNKPKTN